jgi:hypothetical protein
VPNCADELKPKVGQLFDSLEEGEQFYKKYAHSVGFSVRASSETKDKKGVKRWKYFVCSKQGYLPNKSKDKEHSESKEHGESTVKTMRMSLTRERMQYKCCF